ncbi:hypothetical protein [Arthrobacter agilis]|uniref:hypothetical protein n=1 Tax=Arthrobacter agilis TaxID=37921 RepID=UPI002785A011|nr:hypothetical protein [Arthrobacter agilis]MDQ0734047.1 hypothetical protein [Arthrobacter agilis]
MTEPAAGVVVPRRVAIVEPNFTGHRLYYVRLLVEESTRRGDEVFVLLADGASSSDEFKHQLADLQGKFTLVSLRERTQNLDVGRLGSIAADFKTDLIVVPDGDRVARAMAFSSKWKGPGNLSVLVLREKAQSDGFLGRAYLVNALKYLIHRWADRGRNAKIVLLKTALWTGKSTLTTANDPVTMSATKTSIRQVREEIGLDSSRHWFSVLGFVDERKNLPLVARTLAQLDAQRIGFLVAGQCAPTALNSALPFIDLMRSNGGSVIVIDRMLSDLELDSVVSAVDTVIMAHSNDGSSGLFGKAAAAGTRIVAAGSKTLRNDIEDIPELGEWTRLDGTELAAAFARSLVDGLRHPGRTPGTAAFTGPLLDNREVLG